MADERQGGRRLQVRVQFAQYPDVPAIHANHLSIQHLGNEAVLTFYAAYPPILSGTDDEREMILQELEKEGGGVLSVPGILVSRLVIPRDRLADISRTIAENIARAEARAAGNDAKTEG